MDTERWIPIPGYEGLYEISDLGRVRSLERYVDTGLGLRRLKAQLKSISTHRGYSYVILYKDGKRKNFRLHRLVLIAFLGDEPTLEAMHIEPDPSNCALSNLQWGTPEQNRQERHERSNGRGIDFMDALEGLRRFENDV